MRMYSEWATTQLILPLGDEFIDYGIATQYTVAPWKQETLLKDR